MESAEDEPAWIDALRFITKIWRHPTTRSTLFISVCTGVLTAAALHTGTYYTPTVDVIVYCLIYSLWLTLCLPWLVKHLDKKTFLLVSGVLVRLFAAEAGVLAWGIVRGHGYFLQRALRQKPLLENSLMWLAEAGYNLRYGVIISSTIATLIATSTDFFSKRVTIRSCTIHNGKVYTPGEAADTGPTNQVHIPYTNTPRHHKEDEELAGPKIDLVTLGCYSHGRTERQERGFSHSPTRTEETPSVNSSSCCSIHPEGDSDEPRPVDPADRQSEIFSQTKVSDRSPQKADRYQENSFQKQRKISETKSDSEQMSETSSPARPVKSSVNRRAKRKGKRSRNAAKHEASESSRDVSPVGKVLSLDKHNKLSHHEPSESSRDASPVGKVCSPDTYNKLSHIEREKRSNVNSETTDNPGCDEKASLYSTEEQSAGDSDNATGKSSPKTRSFYSSSAQSDVNEPAKMVKPNRKVKATKVKKNNKHLTRMENNHNVSPVIVDKFVNKNRQMVSRQSVKT